MMRARHVKFTFGIAAFGALMTILIGPAFSDTPRTTLSPVERARLTRVLTDALARRDFVGVHAAEALIALGLPGPARNAVTPQLDAAEPKYRIGVWRVLARAEPDRTRRAAIVERVRAVLFDERAVDRVHAMETLAKLNEPITSDAERRAVDAMASDPAAGPFALWRLAQAGDEAAVERLRACARGSDPIGRSRAEYVLPQLPGAAAKTPTATAAAAATQAAEQRQRLERQLNEDDEDRRVAAAFALLQMDDAARSATTRPRE